MIEVKHYKQGSPELDELSKHITHISKVRKGLSHSTTYLSSEPSNSKMSKKTRGEKLDGLR